VARIARDHFLRWRTFAMADLCDGGPSRSVVTFQEEVLSTVTDCDVGYT